MFTISANNEADNIFILLRKCFVLLLKKKFIPNSVVSRLFNKLAEKPMTHGLGGAIFLCPSCNRKYFIEMWVCSYVKKFDKLLILPLLVTLSTFKIQQVSFQPPPPPPPKTKPKQLSLISFKFDLASNNSGV